MASVYRSSAGDLIDAIAWRRYGRVDEMILRAVLNANPNLSAYPPKLPEGVFITLPDIASTGQRQVVRLWD